MLQSDYYRILREVYDENGRDRLLLRLFRVSDAELAWNSDALIWETRSDTDWNQAIVFSREELQGRFPRRRWAADIVRFDAHRGQAIIMLGEYSEPDCHGLEQPRYSWWDCDIRNKCLIRFIKDVSHRSGTLTRRVRARPTN